jgi:hypothetical protein
MITLSRAAITDESNDVERQMWPVSITAAGPGNVPVAVFVYHAASRPLDNQDFFSCVASAAQMTELPEGAPLPGLPFYRRSMLRVSARSAAHAQAIWEKVNVAVAELVENLALDSAMARRSAVVVLPKSTPTPIDTAGGALTYDQSALAYGSQILTYYSA